MRSEIPLNEPERRRVLALFAGSDFIHCRAIGTAGCWESTVNESRDSLQFQAAILYTAIVYRVSHRRRLLNPLFAFLATEHFPISRLRSHRASSFFGKST